MLDLLSRLIPKGDIKNRTVRSGFWSGILNVSDRFLQLIKLGVLARILSPADFGLIGIALLTLGALRNLSELGVEQALIQSEADLESTDLDTAWILKILRGILVLVVAFMIAPYAATFFDEPRVTDIIRVLSVIPLLIGLENPAIVYFQKDLAFHKEFLLNSSKTILDVSLSIILAISLKSIWALVFGILAGNFIRTILSYAIHRYRPTMAFDPGTAKELVSYGKWITGGSIVIFLTTQGDDAFIGWIFTATALGYYQVAYRFGKAPSSEITQVLTRILFPAFSELQSDLERFTATFEKAIRLVAIVSFPMSVGIVVVAPPFVESVLGQQWISAIILLQIVGVHGLLTSIGSISGPIVMAKGRPDLRTKWQLVNLVLLSLFVYPLSLAYGVAGVAAAVVAASFVSTSVALYMSLMFTSTRPAELLVELSYPLSASVIMGLVVHQVKVRWFDSGVASLVALVTLGVVIYAVIIWSMERYLRYDISPVVRSIKEELASG